MHYDRSSYYSLGKTFLTAHKGQRREQMSMVGKKVIVRANVAGVHAGIVTVHTPGVPAVELKNAYRLWRVYTRDPQGSISDVAAHGLKPKAQHQIGAKLPSVAIENPPGLEIAEMTDEAYESLEAYANKGV